MSPGPNPPGDPPRAGHGDAASAPAAPPPRRWRPWPRSLFGRLMGVLALGLMAAQLIGAAINLVERDQLVARGYGVQVAQRIADVVGLLDGLPEAERQRVVAVFGVPPLVLSLHEAPALAPGVPPGAEAFVGRLRAALAEDTTAERTVRAVRVAPRPADAGGSVDDDERERADARGDERAQRRAERQARRAQAEAERRGPLPHPERLGRLDRHDRPEAQWRRIHRSGRPVWRTEVQLSDGRWARFDAALPAQPERLPWRLVASLAVLLLSVLALSWLAVRWVTRPLKTLADAAQGLGEDIDRAPLPETGPTEVRQAAAAFNTMQQRLQAQMRERARLLTALSHDLKTPLTRMRLRAELLDDDEARQRFEADLHDMEGMVTETLDFMRGFAGHGPRAPVDVDALLGELQANQQAMGRDVRVQGQAAAPLVAVASLLKRALGNLVDNAVLYGQRATVQIDDAADALTIRVMDEGPGIPPDQMAAVFEPFHRLEASRNRETGGTGLGLGIARDIARLHGGTLTLHNRPEGGLEARLVLPRRAA